MRKKELIIHDRKYKSLHGLLWDKGFIKYRDYSHYEFLMNIVSNKRRKRSIINDLNRLGFIVKLAFPFITMRYNVYIDYYFSAQKIDLSTLNSIWYYPPQNQV